jgi:hypothetical protein
MLPQAESARTRRRSPGGWGGAATYGTALSTAYNSRVRTGLNSTWCPLSCTRFTVPARCRR